MCGVGLQAQVVREFSPEDVTRNIYSLVDVLLHHVQVRAAAPTLPMPEPSLSAPLGVTHSLHSSILS